MGVYALERLSRGSCSGGSLCRGYVLYSNSSAAFLAQLRQLYLLTHAMLGIPLVAEPEEEPPYSRPTWGGARVCQGSYVRLRMKFCNFFLVTCYPTQVNAPRLNPSQ